MPFIQRIVEPVFLSRPTPSSSSAPAAAVAAASSSTSTTSAQVVAHSNRNDLSAGDEFTSIANCTLSNILRQLASVILCADEILGGLGDELQTIRIRTENIRRRINGVERILEEEIDETVICKLNTIRFPSPPSYNPCCIHRAAASIAACASRSSSSDKNIFVFIFHSTR